MVYSKKRVKSEYTRYVPLSQSMSSEQRVVQDVVMKFQKKGASVRNGELIRCLPLQFENIAIGMINGSLHYWNGRYYEPMGKEEFNRFVYRFMYSCNVQAEAFNSLALIQDKCRDAVMSHKLKIDADKFVFKNGVMDLKTRTFTKGFSPDVIQINSVDYDYVACEPMIWKAFLNQVLPDIPSQQTLQMFLGATLMSRQEAKIEKMLVLYGTGSNGKSVVYEAVKGVLGEDSVSNFGIDEFVRDGDRKKNISDINGRRLNYCSEIRAFVGKDIYDDTLKILISGEPIVARPMFGVNFTARDIPLLMANSNYNMKTLDMSEALRRRIIQLCFNVTIPVNVRDKTLHRKMITEYPGIFDWIVDGLVKLRGNEYKFPDEDSLPTAKENNIERKKVFGSLSDAVKQYLNHCNYGYKCRGARTAKFRMGQTTFFENVKTYMQDNGYLTDKLGLKETTAAFTELGGVITTSGGQKWLRLWATPESVKQFRKGNN